jgi:hypothetical protein
MEINRANSVGSYQKDLEAQSAKQSTTQPQTGFSTVAPESQDAGVRTLNAVAQFKKSDLSDPQKLEGMIRACASELIDSGQAVAGRLSPEQKDAVHTFLSADPCFRQQLESYLQKVIK